MFLNRNTVTDAIIPESPESEDSVIATSASMDTDED